MRAPWDPWDTGAESIGDVGGLNVPVPSHQRSTARPRHYPHGCDHVCDNVCHVRPHSGHDSSMTAERAHVQQSSVYYNLDLFLCLKNVFMTRCYLRVTVRTHDGQTRGDSRSSLGFPALLWLLSRSSILRQQLDTVMRKR